jgi:hypothetical protein
LLAPVVGRFASLSAALSSCLSQTTVTTITTIANVTTHTTLALLANLHHGVLLPAVEQRPKRADLRKRFPRAGLLQFRPAE